MNLPGLAVVNIELTSRCNKDCWMCGRRKIDREYPELAFQYGDMSFDILETIARKLPPSLLIQFHSNGEPLLYPYLGSAFYLFKNHIKCLDTNGKLLLEKANSIIGFLDTLTISVIENDPEGDAQYDIVQKFLAIKKDTKPRLIYRLLGQVANPERWYDLPGIVATRILHNPLGSRDYTKKVTIPEHGICLDLLTHLTIDRWGNCYPCVRLNPKRLQQLGNIKFLSLEEIWGSPQRKQLVDLHVQGRRSEIDLCSTCEYYGCPTSQ